MSNDNPNQAEFSISNIQLLEYLIKKLEKRQKKCIKYSQIFKTFDTFEAFYPERKNIAHLLNELDDDLRQASFTIKALINENKALKLHSNNKDEEIYNLNQRVNVLAGENENLKIQLYSMKNALNNNEYNSNEEQPEEQYEEDQKKNFQIENVNNNEIKFAQNQNDEEAIFGAEQLGNVKNIIDERRQNKMKLKNVIEQHFNKDNKNNIISSENINSSTNYNNNCFSSNINNNSDDFKRSPSDFTDPNNLYMRIMSDPKNIELLNKKMGTDFLQKLLDQHCPIEYINQIEQIIDENEGKKKANNREKRSSRSIEPKINRSFTRTKRKMPGFSGDGFKFEKSLRDYSVDLKDDFRNKRFNNFTNPYGKYFDENILKNEAMVNINLKSFKFH